MFKMSFIRRKRGGGRVLATSSTSLFSWKVGYCFIIKKPKIITYLLSGQFNSFPPRNCTIVMPPPRAHCGYRLRFFAHFFEVKNHWRVHTYWLLVRLHFGPKNVGKRSDRDKAWPIFLHSKSVKTYPGHGISMIYREIHSFSGSEWGQAQSVI